MIEYLSSIITPNNRRSMMQQNVTLFRRFLSTALLAVWLTGVAPVLAQEVPAPKAGEPETSAPAPPPSPVEVGKASSKRRMLTLPGGNLAYAATAEMMPIIDGKGETTAR